jgi:hypothetical protein
MNFPRDNQRHTIYGKTGSGKTVAGLWALEKRSWDKIPWIILDIKRDQTIAQIPRLEEIDIERAPPKQRGLYVTRPVPQSDDHIDRFLWDVWKRGNIGLMVDEGYMINRFSKPWQAVLTQGRSLRIPVITLTQRPSWVSPFLMSETDYHQAFFLQAPADVDKLAEWNVPVPPHQDYSSWYYDVPKNLWTRLAPVPDEQEILDRFDRKMPRRIRMLHGLASNVPRRRRALTIA